MIYLDASAVMPMLLVDDHTAAVEQRASGAGELVVSHFTGAEVVAVIGRKMRERVIGEARAVAAIQAYEAWTMRSIVVTALDPADGPLTISFLRRFDLKLRAPDALHLAICRRLGATLLTFDTGQAAAAAALGIALA